MPLGETLTILATLASAVQALRSSRPTETLVEAEQDVLNPMLLLTMDSAKQAHEETLQRLAAASNGTHFLIALSAATVLLSAFLGAVADQASSGSPLFIANLGIFVVVVAATVLARRLFAARTNLGLGPANQVDGQEAIEKLIEGLQRVEKANSGRLKALAIVSDVVVLTIALQVVLAAFWLID